MAIGFALRVDTDVDVPAPDPAALLRSLCSVKVPGLVRFGIGGAPTRAPYPTTDHARAVTVVRFGKVIDVAVAAVVALCSATSIGVVGSAPRSTTPETVPLPLGEWAIVGAPSPLDAAKRDSRTVRIVVPDGTSAPTV